MTRNWTPLAIVYLVLAVAGLVGTWTYNAIAIAEGNDFIGDLVSSGPAVSSPGRNCWKRFGPELT